MYKLIHNKMGKKKKGKTISISLHRSKRPEVGDFVAASNKTNTGSFYKVKKIMASCTSLTPMTIEYKISVHRASLITVIKRGVGVKVIEYKQEDVMRRIRAYGLR